MTGEADTAPAAADAGHDLLHGDGVPDANQSVTCFSCDTPMVGLFCHACGNKNDDYRRSIWRLAVDFFTNITAMDNRMWRSLWSLVRRPGRMAREYADGARTRWTSPVRFYLATSLILFGYIALSGTQLVAFGERIDPEDRFTPALRTASGGQALQFFIRDSQLRLPDRDDARRLLGAAQANLAPAAEIGGLTSAITAIEAQLDAATDEAARETLRDTRETLITRRDALRDAAMENGATTPDDETGSYNGTWITVGADGETRQLSNNAVRTVFERVLRNPSLVNDGVNARLKVAMFVMLPFAMLMGAIFIRGRERAMLYDHLVHAAYLHGVSFLLLFAFILLHQFTPLRGLVFVYTAILLIYLPISARGMFGRGWFKSVLTAYGVGAVYSFIILSAAVLFTAAELQSLASEYADVTLNPAEASDAVN